MVADDELSMTPKQIRRRAQRAGKKANKEYHRLYKPVAEWDNEELARGRPRSKDGYFSGPKPKWVTREIHEEALRRFTEQTKAEMRTMVGSSLYLLKAIIEDDQMVYDDEGQPIRHMTPASTKLDAAKFLLEQVLGKPKQHVEGDLQVQIAHILAGSVLNVEAEDIIELTAGEDEEEEDDEEEDDED